MDFSGYRKVSVYLGTLSVDDYYPKPCSLRLVLSEAGIGVVCLEVLDLLEMRALLHGTHDAALEQPMISLLRQLARNCSYRTK